MSFPAGRAAKIRAGFSGNPAQAGEIFATNWLVIESLGFDFAWAGGRAPLWVLEL